LPSFLVTLYTGSRWGAGTKADVFLQLIGQNGTSDVHCLRHPQVSSFHQGSTDRFLLTTREELGDICTFRVCYWNILTHGQILSSCLSSTTLTQPFLPRHTHRHTEFLGWKRPQDHRVQPLT
uniref:PLAT domain-containing protein n=1 Tax=Anas zonorhyncha TaxID=75864 RepID=A0A8B9U9R8_9AVES